MEFTSVCETKCLLLGFCQINLRFGIDSLDFSSHVSLKGHYTLILWKGIVELKESGLVVSWNCVLNFGIFLLFFFLLWWIRVLLGVLLGVILLWILLLGVLLLWVLLLGVLLLWVLL